MLAKNLTFLARADAAGIVLGARVPIILTSRADSVRTRLASCAVAAIYANARRRTTAGPRRLMDAILVVNAGSSSLKFQVFGLAGGGLERRVRGQIDGIGVRPRLKAADGAGTALVDRSFEPAEVGDLPAAIAETRDWLRTLEGLDLRAIGHRVVHGGPEFDRTGPDRRGRPRPARPLPGAGAAAPAEQPRADPPRHGDRPGRAAGRLLRHRLPPRPRAAHRLLRPAARALRRGHPPLRLPRPQLRVHRRTACPRSRRRSRDGRVIVAHLGSGASMCALLGGRSVESTMGFTALDGLPMGTRPGQLDPGVVLHLIEEKGMTARRGHPPPLPRRGPQGPLRRLERHARPPRQRRPRRRPSPSTTSSTAAR